MDSKRIRESKSDGRILSGRWCVSPAIIKPASEMCIPYMKWMGKKVIGTVCGIFSV